MSRRPLEGGRARRGAIGRSSANLIEWEAARWEGTMKRYGCLMGLAGVLVVASGPALAAPGERAPRRRLRGGSSGRPAPGPGKGGGGFWVGGRFCPCSPPPGGGGGGCCCRS